MANKKISELAAITGRTQDDLVAMVQSSTTHKIRVEDFMAEPVINAGDVGGAVEVDLSQGHWYVFTLQDNVEVDLFNEREGARYLFFVYSNGNFAVNAMRLVSGKNIYSVGGTLPNPANNAWNLYEGMVINGGMVLTEIDNFAPIP